MSDDLQSNTDISEPSTEYSQENSASINNDAEQNYRSPQSKRTEVKPYDISVKHNFIPERLPALEIINERFARQFRIGLFNLLRRNTDVITSHIESKTFKEFSSVSALNHLNLVHLNPLRGSCLFSFSPELVFIVVDTLFGGDGHISNVYKKEREYTHTEQEIIRRVLNLALTTYQNSWIDVYNIETEYIRSEVESRFTNITSSPDDVILISTFLVEIGNIKANFYICIPYTMIEPIKELLIKPPSENQTSQDDNVWMSSLTSGIKQSTVELVANFANIQTTVAKLLALKVNDILDIEKPTSLDVTIGGVPVLKGHYGSVNRQYAIQVEQISNPVIEQLNEGVFNE
ncbi:flagellar motor switch protein FliM [Gilliamella apicola]|jgi:flagellar motor switch protein FliM|uniref:Flagellar motor switch protein FliM n=1 Tax=Gilliamella apicola TaxID=1196095 RepID=A0A2V4E5T2_9GAMM|nr:flagellar motor switch protein FliM [Gilliamella apicola]PXZ03767.1 flagellar motor switch protein FliM [Gilliamella apicola]